MKTAGSDKVKLSPWAHRLDISAGFRWSALCVLNCEERSVLTFLATKIYFTLVKA